MPVAPTSAAPYLPEKHTLPLLREAVQACRGCDLYRNATQAVFGEIEAERESPKPRQHSAQIMLLGEQPGDREDLEGRPFVGPAGKLLDQALEQAGIPRSQAYVTNAVKHFKWEPRGKRRIHEKPTLREIKACRPWLDAEIEALHPSFKVTQSRGTMQHTEGLPALLATIHPSAILRARTGEDRHRELAAFIADLKQAAAYLATK